MCYCEEAVLSLEKGTWTRVISAKMRFREISKSEKQMEMHLRTTRYVVCNVGGQVVMPNC